MVRFSIFGIPVEIQPWFWLTLGLLGSLWTGDGASAAGILMIFLFILAGFISVLVHELGHALVGRKFGAQTAITLHAFGGYALFPGANFTRWQDFLVTAAGPAVQVVLGGIFLAISLTAEGIPPLGRSFVFFVWIISFYWALLNLIPMLPLDGGRLLASILGPDRIGLTLKIGIGVGVLTAITILYFTGRPFFPMFLGLMAFQNWQELNHRRRP